MHNTIIRKMGALALIAIFVLCITPTSALHALFANHHDQKTEQTGKAPQISTTGIDCHCSTNVVTAPFIPQVNEFRIFNEENFPAYSDELVSHLLSAIRFDKALRGPPILS